MDGGVVAEPGAGAATELAGTLTGEGGGTLGGTGTLAVGAAGKDTLTNGVLGEDLFGKDVLINGVLGVDVLGKDTLTSGACRRGTSVKGVRDEDVADVLATSITWALAYPAASNARHVTTSNTPAVAHLPLERMDRRVAMVVRHLSRLCVQSFYVCGSSVRMVHARALERRTVVLPGPMHS